MPKRADLHVHTHFSDGTFTPEKVVAHAASIGLDCIAICDHDVIDGISPALAAGERYGVEIIPGVELTAEKRGCEIHILAYFIDWQNDDFKKKLQEMQKRREIRIRDMLARLKTHKVHLSFEDVQGVGGEGSLGRLHLATALYQKGYVKTIQDAFRKYIGNGKPCYVVKVNLTPEKAIDEVIEVGGIPVLAHPGVMGRDEYINSYVKHGLMGIEVYHSDHPPAAARRYERMARDLGLLATGGSDCHGLGKGRVLMGSVTVPYSFVEKLKNARR